MAASMGRNAARSVQPVVVVLGATGTGKSKLAVQLAKKFHGEVISADSMQVYKGLDVITNKVTREEQDGVAHHLLGVVQPLSQFTVVDFRDRALPIIDSLLRCRKMPVIVGGTNYYIEALLWKQLIDQKERYVSPEEGKLMLDSIGVEKLQVPIKHLIESSECASKSEELFDGTEEIAWNHREASDPEDDDTYSQLVGTLDQIQSKVSDQVPCSSGTSSYTAMVSPSSDLHYALDDSTQGDGFATIDTERSSSQALHQILACVDPIMAQRLHPNDKRKVLRSLQVFQQYGRRHSDLLQAQRDQDGGGPLGGPLRYKDLCIFWLQTKQEVLDKRLDDRVDEMIKAGLLEELSGFHSSYNQARVDQKRHEELYVHGIFQSIGFKEFHPYLTLPEEDKGLEEGRRLLQEGIERLKVVTRQYARKQLKWVQNRFLKRPGEVVPAVYGLDSTDPSQWDRDVLQPAMDVLTAIRQGAVPAHRPLKKEDAGHTDATTHVCHACDGRVFVGEQQWAGHLASRRHKKRVARARKRSFNEKWRQAHRTEMKKR